MSIKVLSIFSGGGGIDCGFKKAGYDICFSTDFWQPACDTLEKNKVGRLVRCADIRQVDYAKELASIGLSVGDIDVLAGGPPCPAYSKSRFYRTDKKRALEDENSFTLYEYFRALEEIRPKAFFFENVFGFVYKPHQAAFDLLKERADTLGYDISFKVINTANYGVPQIRERFICIGVRRDIGKPFVFPEETHYNPENRAAMLLWERNRGSPAVMPSETWIMIFPKIRICRLVPNTKTCSNWYPPVIIICISQRNVAIQSLFSSGDLAIGLSC